MAFDGMPMNRNYIPNISKEIKNQPNREYTLNKDCGFYSNNKDDVNKISNQCTNSINKNFDIQRKSLDSFDQKKNDSGVENIKKNSKVKLKIPKNTSYKNFRNSIKNTNRHNSMYNSSNYIHSKNFLAEKDFKNLNNNNWDCNNNSNDNNQTFNSNNITANKILNYQEKETQYKITSKFSSPLSNIIRKRKSKLNLLEENNIIICDDKRALIYDRNIDLNSSNNNVVRYSTTQFSDKNKNNNLDFNYDQNKKFYNTEKKINLNLNLLDLNQNKNNNHNNFTHSQKESFNIELKKLTESDTRSLANIKNLDFFSTKTESSTIKNFDNSDKLNTTNQLKSEININNNSIIKQEPRKISNILELNKDEINQEFNIVEEDLLNLKRKKSYASINKSQITSHNSNTQLNFNLHNIINSNSNSMSNSNINIDDQNLKKKSYYNSHDRYVGEVTINREIKRQSNNMPIIIKENQTPKRFENYNAYNKENNICTPSNSNAFEIRKSYSKSLLCSNKTKKKFDVYSEEKQNDKMMETTSLFNLQEAKNFLKSNLTCQIKNNNMSDIKNIQNNNPNYYENPKDNKCTINQEMIETSIINNGDICNSNHNSNSKGTLNNKNSIFLSIMSLDSNKQISYAEEKKKEDNNRNASTKKNNSNINHDDHKNYIRNSNLECRVNLNFNNTNNVFVDKNIISNDGIYEDVHMKSIKITEKENDNDIAVNLDKKLSNVSKKIISEEKDDIPPFKDIDSIYNENISFLTRGDNDTKSDILKLKSLIDSKSNSNMNTQTNKTNTIVAEINNKNRFYFSENNIINKMNTNYSKESGKNADNNNLNDLENSDLQNNRYSSNNLIKKENININIYDKDTRKNDLKNDNGENHNYSSNFSFTDWENYFNIKYIENKLRAYYDKNKTQYIKRVCQGPPDTFRWIAWMITAQIPEDRSEDFYNKFLKKDLKKEVFVQIKKDISRTFPEAIKKQYFHHVKLDFNILRLLKALAVKDPDVGYCQGMNFVAGFLFVVSNFNELETFYMMLSLLNFTGENSLGVRGFFLQDFPLLKLYLFIFKFYFTKKLPSLKNHFDALDIPDELWISKWLQTLFTITLPYEAVKRVWDCILTNGLDFIISFSIALLKIMEKDLLKLSDTLDIITYFKNFSALKDDDEINQCEINCTHILNFDENMNDINNLNPENSIFFYNLENNINSINLLNNHLANNNKNAIANDNNQFKNVYNTNYLRSTNDNNNYEYNNDNYSNNLYRSRTSSFNINCNYNSNNIIGSQRKYSLTKEKNYTNMNTNNNNIGNNPSDKINVEEIIQSAFKLNFKKKKFDSLKKEYEKIANIELNFFQLQNKNINELFDYKITEIELEDDEDNNNLEKDDPNTYNYEEWEEDEENDPEFIDIYYDKEKMEEINLQMCFPQKEKEIDIEEDILYFDKTNITNFNKNYIQFLKIPNENIKEIHNLNYDEDNNKYIASSINNTNNVHSVNSANNTEPLIYSSYENSNRNSDKDQIKNLKEIVNENLSPTLKYNFSRNNKIAIEYIPLDSNNNIFYEESRPVAMNNLMNFSIDETIVSDNECEPTSSKDVKYDGRSNTMKNSQLKINKIRQSIDSKNFSTIKSKFTQEIVQSTHKMIGH